MLRVIIFKISNDILLNLRLRVEKNSNNAIYCFACARKDYCFKRQSYFLLYEIHKVLIFGKAVVVIDKDFPCVYFLEIDVVGILQYNKRVDRDSHLYDQDRQK